MRATPIMIAILGLPGLALCQSATRLAPPATALPAPSSRPAPASKPAPPPKYRPITAEQAAKNRQAALDKAAEAKKIAPQMHLVETEHFMIFSAWGRNDDKALAGICEKMYAAMCNQFGIPPKENIWAGKLALLLFWETAHFEKFVTEVEKLPNLEKAGGYSSGGGDGQRFLVLNHAGTKAWFFELLTHESAHAFIGRYINNRPIPTWLNEGLAEYFAATVADGAQAHGRARGAMKDVAKENKDVENLFDGVEISPFEYGVVQSWVQFLIAADKNAFVKFVTAIKEGKSDEQAMQDAYKLSRKQFLDRWRAAVVQATRAK